MCVLTVLRVNVQTLDSGVTGVLQPVSDHLTAVHREQNMGVTES